MHRPVPIGTIPAVPQLRISRFSAERCAFCAFAIGALLFGASAVEDYLCLSRRSNGQACGVLPPALFYAGIGLALLLLVASVLLWLRTARAAGQQVGGSADD